jgi:hypothetical protein
MSQKSLNSRPSAITFPTFLNIKNKILESIVMQWRLMAQSGGGGGGGGGGARPDLTILNSFSPVFFFYRVIKSRVSGVGAQVGGGACRGGSRCEARTSGALDAHLLPCPPSS